MTMLILIAPRSLIKTPAAIPGPFEAPVDAHSPNRLPGPPKPPIVPIGPYNHPRPPVATHEEIEIINTFA